MVIRPKKDPLEESALGNLPTLYFSRGSAPDFKAAARRDVAYNVTSLDALCPELDRRLPDLQEIAARKKGGKLRMKP